jgi:hypothetical protein
LKDILFVESPLQLLNALEAIKNFDLKNYILYVRYSKQKTNDEQLDKLIKIFDVQPTILKKINLSSKHRTFSDYIKIFFYFFYSKFFKINRLFIGNIDSKFLSLIYKNVPKNKIIALDDGAKTIALQKKFNETDFYNLFTMYNLKKLNNQIIYKNNYNNVKSLLKNKDKTENILFLGTKLNEVGIISENEYILLINKIAKYYNKNIIYIPHRGEDEKKLNKISKFQNFKIKNIDYPVELYGLYEKEIPNTVASFYSTALLSMQNIYGIQSESFYFDFSNSEHKESIESVYEYYKKEMKVINLND